MCVWFLVCLVNLYSCLSPLFLSLLRLLIDTSFFALYWSHVQTISHPLSSSALSSIIISLILLSPTLSSCSPSSIFLGVLGFGLSIMFCTTFCRVCHHFREEQIEREAWQRSEQNGHSPSIYFIPFPGRMSQQDSEDQLREPRHSQELQSPPQYSTVYFGPPPSYNEVIVNRNLSKILYKPGQDASVPLWFCYQSSSLQKITVFPDISFLTLCFHSMHFSWDVNLRIFPLLTLNIMLLRVPSHPHLTQTWFNPKHSHNNNPGPSHCACVDVMDSLDCWTTSVNWCPELIML